MMARRKEKKLYPVLLTSSLYATSINNWNLYWIAEFLARLQKDHKRFYSACFRTFFFKMLNTMTEGCSCNTILLLIFLGLDTFVKHLYHDCLGTIFLQLYPYHLAVFICRVMRISPFRYYCDVLFEAMKNGNQLLYKTFLPSHSTWLVHLSSCLKR